MSENIQRPFKGMVTDSSPLDQPKDTYRYVLNGINESGEEGDLNFISNELGNIQCTTFPQGMRIVDAVSINNNQICIFGRNNTTSYIGLLNEHQEFKIVVNTLSLNFSVDNPIKAAFRLRRNNQRVVYFVDGFNKPRIFNFDRQADFYSLNYKTWLDNRTDGFTGDKWEAIHF